MRVFASEVVACAVGERSNLGIVGGGSLLVVRTHWRKRLA